MRFLHCLSVLGSCYAEAGTRRGADWEEGVVVRGAGDYLVRDRGNPRTLKTKTVLR